MAKKLKIKPKLYSEMLSMLHVVAIALQADLNTRIQQPDEKAGNQAILRAVMELIAKVESSTQ